MNSKTLKILEFDKIAAELSSCAIMDITKRRAQNPKIEKDVKKVNILQAETSEAIALVTKKGSVPIKCVGDVRPSLKRAHMGGTLSMGEILSVGKVLETSELLKKYPDDIECETLSEHFEALYTDKSLRLKISGCIIDEQTISDNASPELADIRRHLLGSTNKIRDILQKIISSPSYQKCLQEQIVTMRGDRYVVPVKAEHRGEICTTLHHRVQLFLLSR